MAKFNLNQLLNSASTNGAADSEESRRPPLKVIPIKLDKLTPSKNNFYSVENVDELKASIEIFGVLQNLTVKPLDNGMYEIISGHRRYKACTELVAEGKTEFEYVPCGIQAERDEIKENIILIMTNSTTRELSDWEKMKQAEELRKNFEILKKRENLLGRVRDLVADALNTSAAQIGRLNAIENNLTPEFKEEFKDGKIGMSAAYELSGMSREQQAAAFDEYKEKGGISVNEVREQKQQPEQTKDGKNGMSAAYELSGMSKEQQAAAANAARISQLEDIYESPEPEQEPPITEEFPKTPDDFTEGENEETQDYDSDFADLTEPEKATAAIDFLESKRFVLFSPGEDTRIFDFIIETLGFYIDEVEGVNSI